MREAARIPSCGLIGLADPAVSPIDSLAGPVPVTINRNFSFFPATPGISFWSHGIRFTTEDEPCASNAAVNLAGTISSVVARPSGWAITRTIPHFASGNTFATGFWVMNTENKPASYSIGFHDDSGRPVRVPFGGVGALSEVSDTVPANGSKYFEIGNPRTKAATTGSAIIHSDPSITIHALFRYQAPGGIFYEAAIPSSAGAIELETTFDNTLFSATGTQILTGIAIANLDARHTATVVCTARNRLGNVIPSAISVPVLNPLGHWARSDFPALAGLRGTLDCISNTRIGMVALRTLGRGAISSLPIIPR